MEHFYNDNTGSGSDSDDEQKLTPMPLVFKNTHNSSTCVFCNRANKKYLRVQKNGWRKVLMLISNYKSTSNESIIQRIIALYDESIRIPSNKIILSGKAGEGICEYPRITGDTIRDHCESYSYENSLLMRSKKLHQACTIMEENCCIYQNEKGEKVPDKDNMKLWLDMINTTLKIRAAFKKK